MSRMQRVAARAALPRKFWARVPFVKPAAPSSVAAGVAVGQRHFHSARGARFSAVAEFPVTCWILNCCSTWSRTTSSAGSSFGGRRLRRARGRCWCGWRSQLSLHVAVGVGDEAFCRCSTAGQLVRLEVPVVEMAVQLVRRGEFGLPLF